MATNPRPAAPPRLLTAKFEQLLVKVAENRPHDNPEIIRKAYEFSLKHHAGQTRASGEPYLIHPLEVAMVLTDLKLDSTAIAAGLLHDAIEDTPVTNNDIRREFGDQVAHIVEGVTKIDKIEFASREERQAENVRKMVLEMVKILQQKLKENGVEARVDSRIKRLYSIHQKLLRQRITVDQVYDLLAVRIITKSVKDCYAALGAIHQMWRPVPGRIKDFIAMPRPNLYQSLHTTVITESGHQFEVQIRTEDMHKMAEEGIAAHWKYKDGSPVSAKDEQRLAWLRQVVEWQQDVKDPNEFLSTLKVDLYPEEVYTFTPKGKVVILPRDASAVDFAYAIHTEVGHTCVGAKVNGRMVPLRSKLHNGDVVEIMTQTGHNPSRDWLGFAKSSRARNKIKHWLNIHQRERAIEIGRKLLEKQARKFRVTMKEIDDKEMDRIAKEYGLGGGQDPVAGN